MDTKTDFNLKNIVATLSIITISSVKNIRRQMSSNLISAPLNEWLVSIDTQSYAALTSQSLCATIGPLQANRPLFHYVTGISRESYLTTGCYRTSISLDHSRFFPPAQYFRMIILPPRQPRVFAPAGSLAINTVRGRSECRVCRSAENALDVVC